MLYRGSDAVGHRQSNRKNGTACYHLTRCMQCMGECINYILHAVRPRPMWQENRSEHQTLFPLFGEGSGHETTLQYKLGRRPTGNVFRPLNCFQKQRVGYRVGQGFVSRNASRNTRGRVQGEVLLVLLISCSNEGYEDIPTSKRHVLLVAGRRSQLSRTRRNGWWVIE